ncbi:MAG: hypothetical protein AAF657_40455, partial [Acidobacteriota bacterium]
DGGKSGSHYRSHRGHSGFHISIGHRGHYGFGGYYGYRGYRGRSYSPYAYYGPHHRHYGPHHPYRYYPYPYRYSYRYRNSDFGRLDFNVKPKKTTQVFIDGNYVGVAGNFDGWPDHLWLEQDSYEVILYNPGYETVVRHVEVQPGVRIDIRETMQPGESTPPEELSTAKAKEKKAPSYRSVPRYRDPSPSREAPRRVPPAAPPAAPQAAPPAPTGPGVLDARGEPARLELSIAPGDASVYLDGHFLGVADELGEQGGILVDPGEHVLEIVRPGYTSREVEFDAKPGKKLDLDVELQSKSSKAGFSA